jgi:hypothetical protein
MFRAFWKYFWGGLYANWAEYAYWKETRDSRCVPVVRSYALGLLIVQARADTVSLSELQTSPLAYLLTEKELTTPGQFGRVGETYMIVDYAHWRMHT